MEREFLTAADIAHALGVTTGRVYQILATGEIPTCRIGKSVRIPKRSWDEYVARKSDEAEASIKDPTP